MPFMINKAPLLAIVVPTPMLPLADKPFIQHVVETLVDRGVTEFDFALNHLPEKIEHLLGNGARWGSRFRFHLARDASRPYGVLKAVSGARDWGSDFAAINSGCGTQIVVSGSGRAPADSLRAFDLPALEAVPASAPLAMDGTVTALWTAPDGKSVLAVVRGPDNEYEVDRVTALCN